MVKQFNNKSVCWTLAEKKSKSEEVYNTDIYAVCSDNASNMKKMDARIEKYFLY